MGDIESAPWPEATRPPAPPSGLEVHVWLIDLEPPTSEIEALWTVLSAEEQARAERFRFARHRRRFTVRRGALRSLLGAYVDLPPQDLEMTVGERGKPRLASKGPDGVGAELEFNLSDSADTALVAVTTGVELGVDIEQLRSTHDLEAIAERFFSAAERDQLAALPEAQKTAGFFRAWTRKEAYLKAIGTGLHTPLGALTVSLRPDEPARILDLARRPGEASRWSLHHLEPLEGHIGALAIERQGNRLQTFRWQL